MKIGSCIANEVCSRYCNTLNHPEEAIMPITVEIKIAIANLSLKGMDFFFTPANFDDIQRLMVKNKKKITAEAINNLSLEKRLIKKMSLTGNGMVWDCKDDCGRQVNDGNCSNFDLNEFKSLHCAFISIFVPRTVFSLK